MSQSNISVEFLSLFLYYFQDRQYNICHTVYYFICRSWIVQLRV